MDNNTILKPKDIYIYGAGKLGLYLKDFLQEKQYKILGIIDKNKSDCLKLEDIKDKNALIVVASINYMYEIEQTLRKYGFKNTISFGELTLLFPQLQKFNQCYNHLKEDYQQNKEKYNELYSILEDEKSKKVLDTIIEYRKTYDVTLFSKICDDLDLHYFEDFMPNKIPIYIDGGAFDGDTAIKYNKFYTNPQKIYFFEPDLQTLEQAKKNLSSYNNIEYYSYGLSDKSETLKFDARNDLGSVFCEEGNLSVKCVALDDIVKENCAFIKFDIEGFEVQVLKGSRRLIENNSPLAICVYHKPQDIWQIPSLIKSINNNYKFYLRHYTTSIFDTVLYGVPIND